MKIQLLGGIVLAFLVWAFLNTPDQRVWQVGLSALLAAACLLTATQLIAVNFHRPMVASGMCLALLLALLWLTGFLDDRIGEAATWLASWLSLERKKPVAPGMIGSVLEWALFVVRWIVLPVLAATLVLRVRLRRFVSWYLAMFPVGLIAPHYLVNRVPKVAGGLWPQMASMGVRFAIAYALTIGAWVWLGRVNWEEDQP